MLELASVRSQLEEISRELDILIKNLQSMEKRSVPGTLQVTGGKKRTNYYHYLSGETPIHKYLSMDHDCELIRKLAQQEYDRSLMKAAEEQRLAIQKASLLLSGSMELEQVYTAMTEAKKPLITPSRPDAESYIKNWNAVTYPAGSFDENAIEIYSERNERVRSKSEKIIADKYFHYPIPYRYEYPIILFVGSHPIEFRPDFTLLNPRTCKLYYHQHLGLLDDPEYVNKNIWKLNVFQKNGIFLGDQLLITYETSKQPFDDRVLDLLIQKYLT